MVIDAGASVEIFSVTVIEVLTGGSAGCAVKSFG